MLEKMQTVLFTNLNYFTVSDNILTHIDVCQLAVRDADMGAMWDDKVFNAGFTISRPTRSSINIWNATRNAVSFETRIDDQVALNKGMPTSLASATIVNTFQGTLVHS